MNKISSGFTFATVMLLTIYSASAVIINFDEKSIPTNDPVNGFGSFTFDDFGGGAVTETATSLVFDVIDSNGSNGVFGGIGVDFVIDDGNSNFVPQDFDAAAHEWELSVKLLTDNEATALRAVFIDDDGAGSGDEHQYEFDLTIVPNDGGFHLLTIPVSTPLFSQGAFGFSSGNGQVDPGLRQVQIQTPFGSTGRLNVEVDFLRIVPIIPEPSSLALLSLSGLTFARTRG